MGAGENTTEYQILEAAETLFLEQGYAKTTTAQIAKLAGCNQALVHYYYRTKDNLFEKIFESKVQLMASNLLSANYIDATFEQRVANVVGMHFDFLRQNPKLPPFIFHEIISNPERLDSLLNKVEQYPKPVIAQFDAMIKNEIEKGTIRDISIADLAFMVLSLNITPFLAMPMLRKVMNLSDDATNQMLEHRKKESIETVLARLRR